MKWKSKSDPQFVIYKIATTMEGDTTFAAIEHDEVTKKPKSKIPATFKLTPHDYLYTTYIILPKKNEQLVYMTERNEGLFAYWINGKKNEAIYEVMTLGQTYPDLKEIIKYTKGLK